MKQTFEILLYIFALKPTIHLKHIFLTNGYIGFLIHSLIQKIFRHCQKDGINFWWHFGVNAHRYIVGLRFGIINLLKLIKI
jgi:hypothetical protein